MRKGRLLGGLLACLLGCSLAAGAQATTARPDRITAELVQNRNGVYRVTFRFRDLLKNDVLPGRITGRSVFTTNRSDGIKRVFIKTNRNGRRIVVVKFTNRFLREVADSGMARSFLRYGVTTACRPKCRTPTSRGRILLRVVSPN